MLKTLVIIVLTGYLLHGPDKGWQGKVRAFIKATAVLCTAFLGIYLYIINLADMSTAKAFAIGTGLLLLYSMSGYIFWAMNIDKFKAHNKGNEEDVL